MVIDLYLSHVLNFSIVPSSFCCLQSYVERGTRGSSHLAEGCNILLSKGDQGTHLAGDSITYVV